MRASLGSCLPFFLLNMFLGLLFLWSIFLGDNYSTYPGLTILKTIIKLLRNYNSHV